MATDKENRDKAKANRKTRRTHKNSRDGCPNCRAKRIKCLEELPSCANCIKKGYRCGYLDFSPERIEHIRKKNILKKQEEEQIERLKKKHDEDRKAKIKQEEQDSKPLTHYFAKATVSDTPVVEPEANPVRHQPIQEHFLLNPDALVDGPGIVPNIPAASILDLPAAIPHDSMHRRPLRRGHKLFERRDFHMDGEPTPDERILRSQLYSSAFSEVPDESGYLDHLSALSRPWDDMYGVPQSINPVMVNPAHPYGDPYFHQAFPLPQPDHLLFVDHKMDPVDHIVPDQVLRPATPLRQGLERLGRPLPQAAVGTKRFRQLTVPEHLQNKMLKRSLEMLKTGEITLKDVRNFQFEETVQPVWTPQSFRQFTVSLFNLAVMLNLYFSFLIEEAVCILLRNVQSKVLEDRELLSGLVSLGHLSPLPVHAEPLEPGLLFLTETLDRLKKMHYITFGSFLQDLRGSITDYHHEHLINMLYMVAVTGFMKLDADILTLFMMLSGTMVLTKTLLQELKLIREVGLGIRQELTMVNSIVSTALQPDYLFDVVVNLSKSLFVYKEIINDMSYNTENGLVPYDHSIMAVLLDPVFARDLNELSLFLRRLQHDLYPEIRNTDAFYRGSLPEYSPECDIHHVLPTLIFNLVYEWLRIYPGNRVSTAAGEHPLRKMLYLFYHALGRCLAHTITPIRWLTLIDPSSIWAFPVGFEAAELQNWLLPQLQTVKNIHTGLVKTIKFLEYRQTLYAYHTGRHLTSNYIKRERTPPPPSCDYKDIVRLDVAKVPVAEDHLSNTMTETVRLANIPLFDEMYDDVELMDIIRFEEQRQLHAQEHEPYRFDVHVGLLNHDFNPSLMIEHYTRNKKNIMYDITLSLEPLKLWCDGYLNDRMESSDAASLA